MLTPWYSSPISFTGQLSAACAVFMKHMMRELEGDKYDASGEKLPANLRSPDHTQPVNFFIEFGKKRNETVAAGPQSDKHSRKS
ncbi:hypothetical protein PG990_004267 [Apiospora arundinis]